MDCSAAPALISAARAVVICVVPSEPDWRVYIAPALILISAIIAILAIINARSVARQKATLDMIEKKESTEHYRALNERFSELRKGRGFTHLNDPAAEDKADRRALLDYLNHYEMVAIGIRQGILDDRFYRAWMEGAFVRDWNAAADWIQRERWKLGSNGDWQYRASLFEHYQWVACRWSKEARKLNENASEPPSAGSGASDEPLPLPADEVVLKS